MRTLLSLSVLCGAALFISGCASSCGSCGKPPPPRPAASVKPAIVAKPAPVVRPAPPPPPTVCNPCAGL